jgi:hypothetical protein
VTGFERLIEDALAKQADRAPHPGPVLNALRSPRRRRPSSWALAVGASATALVVAVAVALPVDAPRTDPGSAVPVSTSQASRSERIALRHSPTWLPDGHTERLRSNATGSGPDGGLQRYWLAVPVDAEHVGDQPGVRLDVSEPSPGTPIGGEEIGVGGRPGSVVTTASGVLVMWEAENGDRLQVAVRGLADARAVAVRVAESVRLDATTYAAPLAPGAGRSSGGRGVVVAGDDPEHRLHLISSLGDRGNGFPWRATLSSERPGLGEGGEPVTARGHAGVFFAPRGQPDEQDPWTPAELLVLLDDGQWLRVTATGYPGADVAVERTTATRDDLVALAEDVVIDPAADVSWLGSRP